MLQLLRSIITLLFLSSLSCTSTMLEINIYLVGDSTMSDKVSPEINPETGWGQVLPVYFDERVNVYNHAVNGRSTKSFIDEGRWQAVDSLLEPGDWVFIQFGHNDQKEYDLARFAAADGDYKKNLRRLVNDALARGANPVLFSPIVRRDFDQQGLLVDTHGAYPQAAEDVAGELDIPFIDLNALSHDMVQELGREASKSIYLWLRPGENEFHPEGLADNTHLSGKGARAIAELVVKELCTQDLLLCQYVKEPGATG